MQPPRLCPNCGNTVSADATLCPNCGASLPPAPPTSAVWPPPPVGETPFSPYAPPPPRLVTGRVWGDIALGVAVTLASMLVGGLGVIIMPLVYFLVRTSVPVFARGVGYTLLSIAALLLGAVALCFYQMGHVH